jgi:hypothetical protein
LSVSDLRPVSRGEVGGRAEVAMQLGKDWLADLSGYYGGSWYEFSGPGVSGNVKDASWGGRLGIDKIFSFAERSELYCGLGLDYGETRSWLKNLVVSEDGPHAFSVGGSLRIGIAYPSRSRIQATGQLVQGVQWAHADDPQTAGTVKWLGRSLAGSAGVRFVLLPGRESK